MASRIIKRSEIYFTNYSSKFGGPFCIWKIWKIPILVLIFFLSYLLLWNTAVFKYTDELKQIFIPHIKTETGISNERIQNQEVCIVPKLVPGGREIYDLDHQQFRQSLEISTPPACIVLDLNDTANTNFTRKEIKQKTMFKTDFEFNLVRLNPNSKLWNNVSCYYSLFKLKPGTEFKHELTKNETRQNLTKSETNLDPSSEYVYVRCKKIGSQKYFYDDYFHNVPIKPDVEQRLERLPATKNPEEYPSVLIFGMDSTSHMNFRRYMPKVHRFLLDQMDAIEFHGFNSLGDGTRYSIYPLFNGKNFNDFYALRKPEFLSKLEKIRHIWQDFQDMGYRTSYGEDCAEDPIFMHDKYSPLIRHPVDYDFRQLTAILEGINSIRNSKTILGGCYGSRLTFQVILDNLLKTAITFAPRNKPYWHFSWTSELTHDVNLYAKYGESILLNALKKLNGERERLLNNTILILMSDHGMRFGPVRQETSQGFFEERMPLLYIILPEEFKRKFPMAVENLRENSNKLVTTYDLHATMRALLNPSTMDELSRRTEYSSERGVSLFRRISNRRTCEMTGIPSIYCLCTGRIGVAVDSPPIQKLAFAVVENMNRQLKNLTQCHQLTLEKVTTAFQLQNDDNGIIAEYEIGFRTKPGAGSFYASVVSNSESGTVMVKNVNRISVYGSDGWCAGTSSYKHFCHCKGLRQAKSKLKKPV